LLIQAIEGQIDKYFSHTKEYFDEKKKQQTLNCHEGLSPLPYFGSFTSCNCQKFKPQ
jgi:hypothetical protein